MTAEFERITIKLCYVKLRKRTCFTWNNEDFLNLAHKNQPVTFKYQINGGVMRVSRGQHLSIIIKLNSSLSQIIPVASWPKRSLNMNHINT